jgi:FkbM family methyltransferase
MKTATVQGISWQMPDDIYAWHTRENSTEVGPQSIWEWHPTIGPELEAFAYYCKQKQPTSFVDIGAHCGIFSSVYCSLVPNHHCLSVEPIKEHMLKLQRTAEANGWHLTTHPIGLSSTPQKAYYYNTHMANFVTDPNAQTPKDSNNPANEVLHEVEIDTLENLVATNNIIPQLIKIDTEGYEVPILEGAREFLNTHKIDLFIETHRDECINLGWKVDTICDILTDDRYTFCTHDLQYQITSLKDYINNYESNMRFIALAKV